MTQIEIIIRPGSVAMRIGDRGGTLIEVEMNAVVTSALVRELTAALIKIRPRDRDPTARR